MQRVIKPSDKEAIRLAYAAKEMGLYWNIIESVLIRIGWDSEEEFRALLDNLTEVER